MICDIFGYFEGDLTAKGTASKIGTSGIPRNMGEMTRRAGSGTTLGGGLAMDDDRADPILIPGEA